MIIIINAIQNPSDIDSNISSSINMTSNNNNIELGNIISDNSNKRYKKFVNLQKNYMHYLNLFYLVLLYGNYSGINKNIISTNSKLLSNNPIQNSTINPLNNNISTNNININDLIAESADEKDNLKQIYLFSNLPYNEKDQDMYAFYYKKNFINLNFTTLKYDDNFNGLIINGQKWALYLNQSKYHIHKYYLL